MTSPDRQGVCKWCGLRIVRMDNGEWTHRVSKGRTRRDCNLMATPVSAWGGR